jgi:hypothetical protein
LVFEFWFYVKFMCFIQQFHKVSHFCFFSGGFSNFSKWGIPKSKPLPQWPPKVSMQHQTKRPVSSTRAPNLTVGTETTQTWGKIKRLRLRIGQWFYFGWGWRWRGWWGYHFFPACSKLWLSCSWLGASPVFDVLKHVLKLPQSLSTFGSESSKLESAIIPN